ncbi:hypothetical protein AAC387_Pa06g1560 [Persea americana]
MTTRSTAQPLCLQATGQNIFSLERADYLSEAPPGSACHCYVASKDQALVSEQVIYVEGGFVDDTKRMQRAGELDVKYCTGFKVDDEIQKMASHIKTFELVGCALKRRFPYEI